MSAVPGALGLPPEGIEMVLRAAMAAPSLHDRQPWSFRVTDKVIEVRSDPERWLPATDPSGREQRMGCGAALFNLRLALERAGVRPMVTLVPDGKDSTLLAAVRDGGVITAGPERAALFEAIGPRRPGHGPLTDRLIPKARQQALIRAAQDERSWLHVVADRTEQTRLHRLAERAHELQMTDPKFRAELAEWTGSHGESPDDVTDSAAGSSPHLHDEWVAGGFAPGHEKGGDAEFGSDPLLIVLCSFHSGALADMQAGQALERVLLTATSFGLTASFLANVVEVAETRSELRMLLQGGINPQMVLQLGYGS